MTMDEDFGEIQPEILKFIFEPEKKISCVIKLVNTSGRYIEFKFLTTHLKLYCVRPIIGIMKPGSTYEVNVTRQACKVLPLSDVISKEKFLIERMFVSEATTLDDVSSNLRSKDGCTDINEKKLKVVVDIVPKVEEMVSKTEEGDAKMAVQMKSKIEELDLRLTKAEETILKLKEQNNACDCKVRRHAQGYLSSVSIQNLFDEVDLMSPCHHFNMLIV